MTKKSGLYYGDLPKKPYFPLQMATLFLRPEKQRHLYYGV